jgi:hypothetical protein
MASIPAEPSWSSTSILDIEENFPTISSLTFPYLLPQTLSLHFKIFYFFLFPMLANFHSTTSLSHFPCISHWHFKPHVITSFMYSLSQQVFTEHLTGFENVGSSLLKFGFMLMYWIIPCPWKLMCGDHNTQWGQLGKSLDHS